MKKIKITESVKIAAEIEKSRDRMNHGVVNYQEEKKHRELCESLKNESTALAEAIAAAEGKARERTQSAESIAYWIVRAMRDIPMSRLKGTVIIYNGGEHFAKSYNGRPQSTHWTAECNGRDWYITDIRRAPCPNRSSSGVVNYGELAKEYIIAQISKL